MSITKEQIFAAKARRIESVDIPEWNGCVFVRSLTVKEQTEYEAEISAIDLASDSAGFTAITLAFQLCAEDGSQLISLAEAREHVKDLNATVVAKIMKAGRRVNMSLTNEAVQDAKGN